MSIAGEDKQEQISGNTLRVYLYVQRKKQSCGVREIQRALGFSSSSSAHNHLEKLADKGFLTRDQYGNYQINNKTKTGARALFIHGSMFPRQLLYAIATTVVNALFLMFFWNYLSLIILLALTPGILACLIFWFETIRLWPTIPSFKESVR